jgi:lipopolysaccharide export system permease protein
LFTRIDRYILGQFLGTFFFTIALIVSISVVFDLSEKIDDFLEHDLSMSVIVLDYYVYFIPYFANLFSPLFIFVAVILFTSRMAYRSEIVAILSAGVSFYRMMVPYMVGCTVLAGLSLVLNNFIIPKANLGRITFENTYINRPHMNYGRHQHYQIQPGTFIYFDSFSPERMTGYKFSMEKFKDGELVYKLMCDHIRFDTTGGHWNVRNYWIREMDGLKERMRTGESMDTVYPFHPRDFSQRLKVVEAMDYWELEAFIEEQRLKGSQFLEYFEVEKHKRFSMPFAAFILTVIGVSLGSRKVRGGIGMHIGLGLLLSFSYILFMQVSQTFAIEGGIPVMVAVWIPNLMFGMLSLVMLVNAPK